LYSFAAIEAESVDTDTDYVWLVEHPEVLEKYVGQWIAVKDGSVIASGKDFRRVASEAKSVASDPLFQKVPELADLVYRCQRFGAAHAPGSIAALLHPQPLALARIGTIGHA